MGRRVERNGPAIARRAALAIDQAVVTSTPVDTGRARSNWQVRLGAPVTEQRDPYTPGTGGATGAANAQAAIAQARAALVAYRGGGQEIYISNPLPYIGRLNEGSSAQAPANFVEAGVQAGIQAVGATNILREDLR